MKVKQILLGLAVAASFAMPAFATPIPFNIDSVTLVPTGNGYGGGSSNEKLDVVFTAVTAPIGFSLDLAVPANTSATFKIADINLQEVCIDPGSCPSPKGNEVQQLGVLVTFHFTSPYTGTQMVTLAGSATPGPVNDAASDYSLTFGSPKLIAFGDQGQFSLDVLDLTFYGNGSQDLKAKITLLNAPTPAPGNGGNVPEPASLALMGVGLAGLAYRGKRRKA